MSAGGTEGEAYTTRLDVKSHVWWKRSLDVQAPYRWNLRRQDLGVTLDVGCGIGRNLASLPSGSLGVDHNETSVAVARQRGLEAVTVQQWREAAAEHHESFDSLLLAHLIEHLTPAAARELVWEYLPALRPGGKALFICPQERGFASDPTHVTWTTGRDLMDLAHESGLIPEPWRSFPLPRAAGRWFTYNEFTVLATKTRARSD